MLNLHTFYRQFEDVPKELRFEPFNITPKEPTSLFVIFQQLTQVRLQKKYFTDRESALLAQAELVFKELKEKGKI